MTQPAESGRSYGSDLRRAVILAPHGRDAAVAASLLAEADVRSAIAPSLPALYWMLMEGAAFAVIAEEALRTAELNPLSSWVQAQPAWSDFPIILLSERGGGLERNPFATRLFATLGNVTLLERPFHPTTLVSAARTALRARERQYEARARIEEIREGQERLRMALAAGGLGWWELELTTQSLRASETCRANFGRASHLPFGYREMLDSVHPDDQVRIREAIANTIRTGMDYWAEHRVVYADGSVGWVDMRGRLVRDADGEARRLTGVSLDITGRKQAEATLERHVLERTLELAAANRQLAAQIEERERAETALRQAQRLEAVGQLTSGVAHDFNNLLTVVLGNIYFLKRSSADLEVLSRLDMMQQAAERGAKLTAQMLAFSRRQKLEPRAVDLNETVVAMRDLLQSTMGGSVVLCTELEPDLWPAMIDPTQIELVLLNLAINARDAMEVGGRLTVSTANATLGLSERADDPPSGDYVMVAVADSGTGMTEQVLTRAFEPFFTTKEVGKGSGLGLSQVFGVARQSGGGVQIHTLLGEGTTVRVYLPRATEQTVSDLEQEATDAAASVLDGRTILLVDDDHDVRDTTAALLREFGYGVIEAGSGGAALDKLASGQTIDLLLLDFAMPGMNGAEVAREARKRRPSLPILYVTGYADAAALTESPAIDVLHKPYRPTALASEIAKLLGARTPVR